MNTYQIVTERIIEQMQRGVIPWKKPWSALPPANLVSGKEYRGLNIFLLASQGYGSRYWLTFNQAKKLGGHVRKGEHSSIVTFWNIGEEKIVVRDGVEKKTRPIMLRYYNVFNATQCDGLKVKSESPVLQPIEACESLVAAMPNPPTQKQADKAYYRPSTDTVGMPARGLFRDAANYYATLFHELSHSTGHASRVGRPDIESINPFGSESYSREELVAELGAAMLCGVTGISPAVIENNAAYLANWIEVLKGDSRLLIGAASAAQKAADYIRGIKHEEEQSESTTGVN